MSTSCSIRVCVPVTDLRRKPCPSNIGYERDFLQETQLLYGEEVRILDEAGEWCFVEALHQPKYVQGDGFKGYPGWVLKSHLSESNYQPNYVIQKFWASLHAEPSLSSPVKYFLPFGSLCECSSFSRKWQEITLLNGSQCFISFEEPLSLLQKANHFICHPYLWGGCSPYSSDAKGNTGVDCSGLVHLLYRSFGRTIPRDACDQLRSCERVDTLKTGDLIFRAHPESPDRVDHVMFYKGDGEIIEAVLDQGCVRKISCVDKFGVSEKKLSDRLVTSDHIIFLGRQAFAM